MNKKLFADLVESMEQMNEIVRGERAPSRPLWLTGEESDERWLDPKAPDSNP